MKRGVEAAAAPRAERLRELPKCPEHVVNAGARAPLAAGRCVGIAKGVYIRAQA